MDPGGKDGRTALIRRWYVGAIADSDGRTAVRTPPGLLGSMPPVLTEDGMGYGEWGRRRLDGGAKTRRPPGTPLGDFGKFRRPSPGDEDDTTVTASGGGICAGGHRGIVLVTGETPERAGRRRERRPRGTRNWPSSSVVHRPDVPVTAPHSACRDETCDGASVVHRPNVPVTAPDLANYFVFSSCSTMKKIKNTVSVQSRIYDFLKNTTFSFFLHFSSKFKNTKK